MSDTHQSAQLVQASRSDAVDLGELIDAGELAVGLPPRHDRGRGDRADSRQRVQLLDGRGVEVDHLCLGVLGVVGFGDPGAGPEPGGLPDAGAEPELTELPSTAGCPETGASPTTICSPSPTGRAIFSPMVSAPSTAPPAACTASAIRAPGARVTSPGVCTRPTTLTTTGRSGLAGWPAPGLDDDLGLADAVRSTGGSLADITGAGRSRTKVNTVISTASVAITAMAMAPARPGSARTLASQPAALGGVRKPARQQRVLVVVGC